MSTEKTTGELIKEARLKANMTQKELAAILGIPYQGIGQWERGVRKPKIETIRMIAQALDVDVYSLVDFDTATQLLENSMAAMNAKLQHLSPKEQSLILAFVQLNDEGQDKAIERVEELIEIPKYRIALQED